MSTAVRIPAGGCTLDADLAGPDAPTGVVAFAHGSGSSRHSPRNREVAAVLQGAGLATLLADLLTPEEEQADLRTGHLRFDIGFLAGRLGAVAHWLSEERTTSRLPVGFFGASTGGAAALVAAARQPQGVSAVVSRGGRPDLAGADLGAVRAPTLLIVGGRDDVVLDLNREALGELRGEKRLEVVPGATHLFEEPGALQTVASLARSWFLDHLH
ncbi:MAG TPA: dienelactone hydrolase family protein [Acidimicrobiales bacterium]